MRIIVFDEGGSENLINYMKLRKFSLFFYDYIFLDTDKYMADQLFINHCVRVKFGSEFIKAGTPYRFICCRIKKKDEQQFLAALNEMDKKAILLGYHEYEKYCGTLLEVTDLLRKNEQMKK